MSSRSYRWLSYASAASYLAEADRLRVSEVARGPGGFMQVYARAGSAGAMKKMPFSEAQTWGQRRHNFIKRHMAEYEVRPSYRRWLALAMWAYRPPGAVPRHGA